MGFEHRIMLFAMSTALLASMTTMMALFLGSASTDVTGLNSLLGAWLIAVPLWLSVSLIRIGVTFGQPLRWVGRRLPAWLLVFCAGTAILALLALLAVIVVEKIAGDQGASGGIIPALAALVSLVGLCVAYAITFPESSGVARHRGPL